MLDRGLGGDPGAAAIGLRLVLEPQLIEMGQDVFGHSPSDQLLNVPFEDWPSSLNPSRIIPFISAELEDDGWLGAVSSISQPTPFRLTGLEAHRRTAVTEACRPGVERLGYPVDAPRPIPAISGKPVAP